MKALGLFLFSLLAGAGGAAWWASSASGYEDDALAAGGSLQGALIDPTLGEAPEAEPAPLVVVDDDVTDEDGPDDDDSEAVLLPGPADAVELAPSEEIADEIVEEETATEVADTTPSEPLPEVLAPQEINETPLELTFDELIFPDYDPPELREDDQEILPVGAFPEVAQGFHQKRVTLDGFMLVLDFEDQRVKTFVLCRNPPGCCFADLPVMDEWVVVTVDSGIGTEYSPYELITVTGVFDVGEEVDALGYAQSLYRMSAESISDMF